MQGTGIRDQGSGIRDQGTGIRDQGSGIRDQMPDIRHPFLAAAGFSRRLSKTTAIAAYISGQTRRGLLRFG
jgi:hypothetical protein